MNHRGFEPRTPWLKVRFSTNWDNDSYKSSKYKGRETALVCWYYSHLRSCIIWWGVSSNLILEWAEQDSNLRNLKAPDLQSGPLPTTVYLPIIIHDGTWTHDTMAFYHMLYQLSYMYNLLFLSLFYNAIMKNRSQKRLPHIIYLLLLLILYQL